jgi:excisionase family DNA binding protein
MSTASTSAPAIAIAPLLINVGEVAKLTGLGIRTIWRLSASSGMPAPRKVGGRRLWSYAELTAWVEAGCPEAQVA